MYDTAHPLNTTPDIPAGALPLPGFALRGIRRTTTVEDLGPLVRGRLAEATTATEEVVALAAGQPERNTRLFLDYFAWDGHDRPSAASLAPVYGCSRERVRQLVTRHTDRLQIVHLERPLALPHIDRALDILDRCGGALPLEQWQSRCAIEGVELSLPVIHAMQGFGELGLLRALRYLPHARLWATDAGSAAWTGSELSGRLRGARVQAHVRLRRTGAIAYATLARLAPFDPEHLLELCLVENRREIAAGVPAEGIRADDDATVGHGVLAHFRSYRGWLIARNPGQTRLAHELLRCLAVAEDHMISVDEFRRGFARLFAGRERWTKISRGLMRALLESDARFSLGRDMIRATSAAPRARFHAFERAWIRGMNTHAGVLNWSELRSLYRSVGNASFCGEFLLTRSWLRRLGRSLHAVRGRPITETAIVAAHARAGRVVLTRSRLTDGREQVNVRVTRDIRSRRSFALRVPVEAPGSYHTPFGTATVHAARPAASPRAQRKPGRGKVAYIRLGTPTDLSLDAVPHLTVTIDHQAGSIDITPAGASSPWHIAASRLEESPPERRRAWIPARL